VVPTLGKKIKVCHIISGDLWAGAENQAYSLTSLLEKDENIELCAVVFNRGILFDKLRELSIESRCIPESQYSVVGLGFRLLKVIEEFSPHILHTHGYKETFLAGLANKISGGRARLIRTWHGIGLMGAGPKYFLLEYLNSRFLTDRMIAVSDELKRELMEKGISSDKIKIIHNGINIDTIKSEDRISNVRSELGISEEKVVIGTVARLVKIKGLSYFVQAAKLILERKKDVTFLVAGDGPLFHDLVSESEKLGISSSMKFLGFRADIYDIINTFDIFVLPSLHEGIPMVLLEAMALRKPIVATNVGGIPEIIEDAKNGLLVPSGKPELLASACLRLIKDSELRKQIGYNAFEVVRTKFSSKRMLCEVLELYKQCINRYE